MSEVWLNLGSSGTSVPLPVHMLTVDKTPGPNVDLVADLEKPWPFEDGSIAGIYARDFPEHLRVRWDAPDPAMLDDVERLVDLAGYGGAKEAIKLLVRAIRNPVQHFGAVHFMNEAYRVLRKAGTLHLEIPSTDGRGWAQDPTHVSFWNINSLSYYCGGGKEMYPDLIKCHFRPMSARTTPTDALGICWVQATLEAVN